MRLTQVRLVACALLATLLLLPAPAVAKKPNLTCTACLLLTDDGTVLFSRKVDEALPNASTTKMVTALLVREKLSLEQEITVSEAAAGVGEGGQDLIPGDTFSTEELLYTLLLTSSNDAAVALAEAASGSEAAFVEEMNSYMDEIGAPSSHFVTPHGLDRPGHEASASDLAVIAQVLLADPLLARIVRTASTTIQSQAGPLELENRNLLLNTYRGAIGVKTGFTDDAGNVLVSAAERRGVRLIAVVMHSEDSFIDSRALLNHGWEKLRRTVLVAAGDPVGAVVFDPAGGVAIEAAETVRGVGHPEDVRLLFDEGDEVGTGQVHVLVAGHLVATVPASMSAPEAEDRAGGFFAGLLHFAAQVTGRIS